MSDTVSYGASILPVSDIKELRREQDIQRSGVQYWKQQFGSAGQSYAQQASASTADFSDAVAKAYAANLKNRDAALSKGGAAQEAALNRQSLMSLYNNYISNYGTNLTNAAKEYAENVSAIDTALTEEAKNYQSAYNAAYDYLKNEVSNLYYGEGEEEQNFFTKNGLEWLTKANEDGTIAIREWSDLLGNELTDEEGQLTDRGRTFFDAMFNLSSEGYTYKDDEGVTRRGRGFDEFLSETNPDLRTWWASQSPINWTDTWTKGASVRESLGLKTKPWSGEPVETVTEEPMTVDDEKAIEKRIRDQELLDWLKKWSTEASKRYEKADSAQEDSLSRRETSAKVTKTR